MSLDPGQAGGYYSRQEASDRTATFTSASPESDALEQLFVAQADKLQMGSIKVALSYVNAFGSEHLPKWRLAKDLKLPMLQNKAPFIATSIHVWNMHQCLQVARWSHELL